MGINGFGAKTVLKAAGTNVLLGAAMAVGYFGVYLIVNAVERKAAEKQMLALAEKKGETEKKEDK